jgi:hypothetical protein
MCKKEKCLTSLIEVTPKLKWPDPFCTPFINIIRPTFINEALGADEDNLVEMLARPTAYRWSN